MRILIVGAGPAGATLALLLARHGIDVTLIERERHFDRVFRGEGLMPSGIDALIQMGLQAQFERLPTRCLDAWEFYVDGQRLMKVREPEAGGVHALRIVSQPALLEMLVAEASRFPSFQFECGVTVRDVVRSDTGGSILRADTPSGRREIHGDYVIGADGRASAVRKRAEIPLDVFPQSDDVVWYTLPLPARLREETTFFSFTSKEGGGVMYPAWDDRLRVGWGIPKGSYRELRRRPPSERLEEIARLVTPEFGEHIRRHKAEASEPVLLDVIVGRCPQWSMPGVLLLGDAAHPMSPVRAQGINLALRDAIVAANHLVPVLRAGGAVQALDATAQSIQAEREPEIVTAQRLQLAENAPPPLFRKAWFRTWIQPRLERSGLLQRGWLRSQKELRYGVVPVRLEV